MTILLLRSMCIFVNPACTASLVSFLIVATRASKIRLNAATATYVWLTFIFFNEMIRIHQNLSWQNAFCVFLHAIQYIFLRLFVGLCGFDGCIDCMSLHLMRYLASDFLVSINATSRLGISCRNTLLILVFHMLHMNVTTLSILAEGLKDCKLNN